ncbi:transcriptional regulator [Nitratireductor indicus C115]|uniref:Transcriptional regulator n=1 Tax=Nitratireductor indicus C115 TaxID=1231190 RepID=K2P1X6_9HYPH|nr:sugar-binding transcriptional regulator [Nitratireductor indicus]EKF41396.1 transcriptional regulator [Nitratireductor indicus C115]SFQ72203.1 DNA-binding transcriptional regulator LsrR, DeoR family [Nitratireductor indicus]
MAYRPTDQIIHKAAWLYYTHGLRQDEVAQRLNISRASVALYLRKAREAGIVNISTSTHLFSDDRLARQVEDAFGLETVWLTGDEGLSSNPAAEIPMLAANVFLEMVQNGDRVCVAWGRTVYQIADAMNHADREDVTVVEMCGNLGSPYSYRPDQCTMEIARRLNAKGLNFYAPLVLSSRALAEALRAEPVIREQLDGISACDLALFTVGTLDSDSHVIKCGALGLDELAQLKAMGATGVIAGQIITADGTLLDCDYNKRMISADFDAIRAIPKRLMVVQEDEKLEPLRAAISGRFFTHLVTTSTMAAGLLASHAAAKPTPA